MCFITNAGGATHIVTEEEFERLSSLKGFRAATPEEIAQWKDKHLPRDSSAQAPGESAETVLPADGGETNNLAAEPGPSPDKGAPADNSPQESSTGDDASTSNSPATKPRPAKAGGSSRSTRTSRRTGGG